MSSRIIRDGLLDSESISSLHDRTFRLYIHLLLAADDYGLAAIGYGPIKRAAPLMDWSRELIAKMLLELTDVGLILPYEVLGKQYVAIAKWKSAINCLSPKHPTPPFGMRHIIGANKFKSSEVREAALKIAPHIKALILGSGAPVSNERVAGSALVPEEVIGKREKKDRRKFSADDFSFAKFMFSKIQELNPSHREPDLEKWADEIRLMRERDKHSPKDIQELFTWANSHPFWRANILSPGKLRDKFDTLKIQRDQSKLKPVATTHHDPMLGAI